MYTFHSTGSLLQVEEIDFSGTGGDETQLDTGDGESRILQIFNLTRTYTGYTRE